jgi:EAL domain-containing protein (putative c-di-GMP-specific phosphodiesterase class I)/GGDEF domain-containing protein
MDLQVSGVHAAAPRTPHPGYHGSSDLRLLYACLEGRLLHTDFQPIIEMRSGRIFGFEALSRGPVGSAIEAPGDLFAFARRHGLAGELERIAAQLAFERFADGGAQGKVFVNFSPAALESGSLSRSGIVDGLRICGLAPKQVVIELTENESIGDRTVAWNTLLGYRDLGFEIAIDDLGEGFASLKLWSELRPEYVKVDRHFINGLNHDALKLQMTRAIQQIAQISGSHVIAEGIEDVSDLMAVRDLGMRFGQGYLIERPRPDFDTSGAAEVWRKLSGRPIPAFPEPERQLGRCTARRLLRTVEPVSPSCGNDEVYSRFDADPELQAIPVVEHGLPRGIVNRLVLIDRFARPYRRELFGKRSCTMFMNPHPVVVDVDMPLQEISFLVTEAGHRAVSDGFIVTTEGRYAGVGTGADLIREITEQQISAARYANPLTLLPGNVPIAQHIERLIAQGCRFAVCHCDLDNFKPYNDVYGYHRGDEVIQLTAKLLVEACESRYDFAGHIGGDDFVLVLQSADWDARCRAVLGEFDARVVALFGAEDAARGAFHAEDRRGNRQSFPLTSLSIGAVAVEPGTFHSHYEVAAAAGEAKKQVKRAEGSTMFIERREYPPSSLRPTTR